MNQPDRLERDLTAWLSVSAAPRTPFYVNDLLAQTSGMRQRPAWLLLERWLPMGTATLPRRALTPLPWRSIGLLILLGLLMLAAAAIYVGATLRAVPAPYGVAGNGAVALAERGDIVLVDPITGSRTVVVADPEIESSPLFSLDGTRLAFLRADEAGWSAWVADTDGANQRQLTGLVVDGTIDTSDWEWAPDGRSIVLAGSLRGQPAITVVPTDGSGDARTLDVGMPAEQPTWRPPDGREILFRGTSPAGFGLYAVRPDGTGVRPVTPSNGVDEWDALYFGWSPDGDQVAYQWRDGAGPRLLYVVPAEGGAPRSITTEESAGPVAWSPDGKSIAFFDDTGPARHVSVVAADGSGSPIRGPFEGFGNVLWAPDGTKILLQSDSGAMLLDPKGGPAQPAWSIESEFDWQRLAP
jgi:Tol biopolymer transport system component